MCGYFYIYPRKYSVKDLFCMAPRNQLLATELKLLVGKHWFHTGNFVIHYLVTESIEFSIFKGIQKC